MSTAYPEETPSGNLLEMLVRGEPIMVRLDVDDPVCVLLTKEGDACLTSWCREPGHRAVCTLPDKNGFFHFESRALLLEIFGEVIRKGECPFADGQIHPVTPRRRS
jgi:hypothetical protein